ncbi:MAG: HlyC/CorC family transporter [Candidatus Dadabacteria bacterium]|nr:MAG: HlyC/CorC family transporter [Candidatus Dadabacteria bacterium]
MIYILIISVAISVIVSASCSLMEASLYAVPVAHVRHLAKSESLVGKLLLQLKEEVSRPIAAILILNTIANTAGASVAGWAVGELYGQHVLAVFSVLFILTILFFSEIIPKTVGVVYCREVAKATAVPLYLLVRILTPLIVVSEGISKAINRSGDARPIVSHHEVLTMAEIGTEEGALDRLEGSVIKNVIGLDQLLVRDVLTPRVVVFRLEENTKLEDIEEDILNWTFSRVPLYSESDPDHLNRYVTQRDVYRELLKGNKSVRLKDISRKLPSIPELMRVDQLLLQMFEQREHICAVVDEHGGLAGIITLEDIIEEIVGREIVDEYDTVSDLRTFAKILKVARTRKKKRKQN